MILLDSVEGGPDGTPGRVSRFCPVFRGWFCSILRGRSSHHGDYRRTDRSGTGGLRDWGAVSAKDPVLLLDAWAEAYEFHEHDIHKGHITARSPRVALKEASHILTGMGIEHAVTGLAAAWHYTAFAGFRLITFYTEEMPDPHSLKQLGYRETDSGANLWLVVPKDPGVFAGTVLDDDVPFVSAVQAFLDLRGHPERASEAAEELRRKCLKWESHERE